MTDLDPPSREIVWLVLGFVVGLVARVLAYARMEEVRILEAAGWQRVGFNFMTGPVMVPPPPDRGLEWLLSRGGDD